MAIVSQMPRSARELTGSGLCAGLLILGGLATAAPTAAASAFDGTWRITRSIAQGCPAQYNSFPITIRDGVVSAPGGKGSVSGSGHIEFSGRANRFSGTLRGDQGSGTYTGRCSGSFQAVRK